MLQKIAKLITNNFGLKCLAVIVAVIFWLVIVNLEDPEKTRIFTVQVEIENADYLTNMGKTYEVLNGSDTISFSATGKRSAIERISASDFKVTANMEDIVNMSEIPITITLQRYSSQVSISKKTMFVEVNVENLVTQSFDIEVETSGEMEVGYSISDLKVSPGEVSVTGPESVVAQIAKAVADADINSMDEDFVQEADIILYDEKGNVLPMDRLTLNHQTATVSAGVLQTKTVPVEYETSGTLPSGYRINEVSGTIKEVVIQGKKKDLETVDELLVSGAALSVSGRQQSAELSIDLNDYLPKGVSLAKTQEETSTVTIEIEGMTQSQFDVPSGNIEMKNIPDGYTANFEDTLVPVLLQGYASDLEEISVADIKGSVDLSGLEEGSHSVSVVISGDYQVAEPVRTTVILKQNTVAGNVPDNDEPEETTE